MTRRTRRTLLEQAEMSTLLTTYSQDLRQRMIKQAAEAAAEEYNKGVYAQAYDRQVTGEEVAALVETFDICLRNQLLQAEGMIASKGRLLQAVKQMVTSPTKAVKIQCVSHTPIKPAN